MVRRTVAAPSAYHFISGDIPATARLNAIPCISISSSPNEAICGEQAAVLARASDAGLGVSWSMLGACLTGCLRWQKLTRCSACAYITHDTVCNQLPDVLLK